MDDHEHSYQGIQGFDPQPYLPLEGRWMFLRLQSFERIAMLLVSPPRLGHDKLRGGKRSMSSNCVRALLVLLVGYYTWLYYPVNGDHHNHNPLCDFPSAGF